MVVTAVLVSTTINGTKSEGKPLHMLCQYLFCLTCSHKDEEHSLIYSGKVFAYMLRNLQ